MLRAVDLSVKVVFGVRGEGGRGGHLLMRVAFVLQHQSLVIRADTPAEMMQWYRRLKSCADGPGSMRAPPPRPQMASTADPSARQSGRAPPPDDGYHGGYGVLLHIPLAFLSISEFGISADATKFLYEQRKSFSGFHAVAL